ncbi:hypothetical protein [Halarsenatibacter silvermanii]|uniref:Uncharacterized protein n=1 Tax=Halarsenatibacter silvermanii TaxID=321763 RepID=A0A1G9S942_9FIRM|nr:hypothetical protein [Halarsenatibacter silvermanii]SDM31891.1 hypothetical protein SAMN04488692_1272 [Halarsenatibacter silvermanii]
MLDENINLEGPAGENQEEAVFGGNITDHSIDNYQSEQEVELDFAGLDLTVTITGRKWSEKDDIIIVDPSEILQGEEM